MWALPDESLPTDLGTEEKAYTNLSVQLSSNDKNVWRLFGKYPGRNLAGTLTIFTEVFCDFLQPLLQSNKGLVPQIIRLPFLVKRFPLFTVSFDVIEYSYVLTEESKRF
jgi:hypothetical protein